VAINHKRHTVVIGAGIVGVCCAIELLRRGHRVSLLEPDAAGGEQAASYGNGAWISPASIVPMSMPGLWRKIPSYLLNKKSPLTISWRNFPQLLPWLRRFLWAGASTGKVQATAKALHALLHDAPQRHISLAAEAGVNDLIVPSGLLYVYPNRTAFEAESLAWQLRRDNGVAWTELDVAELHRAAPALAPHYTFAVNVTQGAHCRNPGAYVAALHDCALKLGAERVTAHAIGFEFLGTHLTAVNTSNGALICNQAVIAAGIHSKALAQQAGDKVCLESERGYHVELPNSGIELNIPIMPSDGKMANTVTQTGLRAAGQVELASVDAPPNWGRAEILLEHLKNTYPGINTHDARRWMGHRPSTPNGLPIIRRSNRSADVVYAFGHGHVGLAAAPASAQRVAQLLG
jgi:D-amino-acid dehydrogenase